MIIINIFKLIILLSILILSSVSDIKTGIIKNEYLIISFVLGIILNVLTWIYEPYFIKLQIINVLIVDLLAVLMYVFRVWAGGDCKLIIVVSMLIPFDLYYVFINPYYSLVILLAFIFIFSYMYLLYDSIKATVLKRHSFSRRNLLKGIKNYIVNCAVNISYIVLIDQVLLILFNKFIEAFPYTLLTGNICIVIILSTFPNLKNKYLVISVIFVDFSLSIAFNISIINKTMIINYCVACLVMILKLFIDEYNYETIPTSSVKSGMILSLNTTILFTNSRVQGLPTLSNENLKSRLTEEEAKSVLRWEKSKYGKSEVQIVRKIPFAIFIALGTIFFLILGAITK